MSIVERRSRSRAMTFRELTSRDDALLALRAPTAVRTSAAHLALRTLLHPVLARPLVHRGSLPLRAALRQLISALLIDIDITDVHEVVPDVRPPNSSSSPSRARRAPEVNRSLLTSSTAQRDTLSFLGASGHHGASATRAAAGADPRVHRRPGRQRRRHRARRSPRRRRTHRRRTHRRARSPPPRPDLHAPVRRVRARGAGGRPRGGRAGRLRRRRRGVNGGGEREAREPTQARVPRTQRGRHRTRPEHRLRVTLRRIRSGGHR